MSRRTMNWKFVESTLLVVHGLTLPDAKEWDEFILESTGAGPKMRQVLVFADVELSPVQRKQIANLVAQAATRAVAVVCFSRLTRVVVTGLGWMTRIHRAFAPTALNDAFEFLRSTPTERAELLRAARAFAAELGHAELLRYFEEPGGPIERHAAR